MPMRRSPQHRIILISMLAAAGCTAFAVGAESSHGAGAATPIDARAVSHARQMPERPALRSSSAVPGTRIVRAPEGDAPFIAPVELADTNEFQPGALLGVWLNDRSKDLRTLTSEPSLGTAVVRGDFFRYTSVLSDANLRGFWGQPLALKWSAILQINQQGEHVFLSELSQERNRGAIYIRTLVMLNDETLFEEDMRDFLTHTILRRGSRTLTLAPGKYRLEVWLAVHNVLNLPGSTQLGTFVSMREPGLSAAVPLPASRISHPVPPRG